MDILFKLLLILTLFNLINCNCNNEQKCQISRVLGMIGADCYNRDFREFPKCIRKDVEIIDLTKNRIKKLTYTDLEPYKNLKMLYLQDNFLLKIDDNTFNNKIDLTTLDLSNNGMSKLPLDILHLPSLQSFYLSQNTNTNIIEIIENSLPITSPLTQFDLSFTEIERLPDLGIIPTLIKYNISGNNLYELNVKQFSGLCGLKQLITNNITINLEEPCNCWIVNKWLRSKQVQFKLFDCELRENLCKDTPFNTTDIENFDKCSKLLKTLTAKSMMKKYIIPFIICLLVFILCIGFLYRRKRKVNNTSYDKKKMEMEQESLEISRD